MGSCLDAGLLSLQNCEKQISIVDKSSSLWYSVIAAQRQVVLPVSRVRGSVVSRMVGRLPSVTNAHLSWSQVEFHAGNSNFGLAFPNT
jgi:hypothetical protein